MSMLTEGRFLGLMRIPGREECGVYPTPLVRSKIWEFNFGCILCGSSYSLSGLSGMKATTYLHLHNENQKVIHTIKKPSDFKIYLYEIWPL